MKINPMFKKYVTYKIYGIHWDTNEPIHSCNIHWDRDKNKYWCEILPEGRKYSETIPYLFKYRLDGSYDNFLKNFETGWEPPTCLSNLDSDYLEFYLSERVIPPNRDLLKETLEAAGIYEYDWRVLIRLNHGRVIDDENWVDIEESDENPNPDGEY